MGIVSSLLGDANPFSQFVADNRSTIKGAFAGFGTGAGLSDGLSRSVKGAANGGVMDDARRVLEEEKAQQQQALNQTTEWLRNNGKDALYQAVSSGAMEPGQAWKIALDEDAKARSAASAGPDIIEVNGQLVNKATGQVVGDYRDPNAGQANPPSGYQWQPDGSQAFIPGGPADPAMVANKPPTEAQNRLNLLSSVIDPELETVEKNWNDLTSGQNQAANAAPFGAGYSLTSPGYQQATNSLGTIAQSYLYAVSGASAPVEEVKKLVDSVTPKPFESAESVANKQLRIRQMAAAVKQAANGGRPQASAPAANTTSTGLSWSIEP